MCETKINNLVAFIISVCVALALCGCGNSSVYESYELSEEEPQTEYEYEEPDIEHIYVYICGQVNKPGVYEMPVSSRLYELLQRAGGYTKGAAETYLNQADILTDGEKIYVPSVYELEESPGALSGAEGKTERVNINTAKLDELQTISGIGESRARDIIAYRESNGRFGSIEDIMKVPGIKEGLFSKIKEQITVDG